MRTFLNNILAIIGSTSLTDGEFATVLSTTVEYSQSTYDDLASVLESRESVSTTIDRLNAYYLARGVTIEALETGKTNIFIGAVLD